MLARPPAGLWLYWRSGLLGLPVRVHVGAGLGGRINEKRRDGGRGGRIRRRLGLILVKGSVPDGRIGRGRHDVTGSSGGLSGSKLLLNAGNGHNAASGTLALDI